ncbi:hypothetical protein D3C71_1274150 [compost metagenome]
MVRVGLDHPRVAAEPGIADPCRFALHGGRHRALAPGPFGLVQFIDGIARRLEHGLVARIARVGRGRRDGRRVWGDAESGRCAVLERHLETPGFQHLVVFRRVQADPRPPAPAHGAAVVQRIQGPVIGELGAVLAGFFLESAVEGVRVGPHLLIQQRGRPVPRAVFADQQAQAGVMPFQCDDAVLGQERGVLQWRPQDGVRVVGPGLALVFRAQRFPGGGWIAAISGVRGARRTRDQVQRAALGRTDQADAGIAADGAQ